MLKTSIKNFVTIVKKKYEIWSLNGVLKFSSALIFEKRYKKKIKQKPLNFEGT